jgi:NDP-sugar pyrophosphorylase family protein
MFPVVILAGGLATRMRPLTEKLPKSLLEVSGEPFIIHQLRYLKLQGITKVIICAGYLGEMIEALVNNGEAFGLNVQYSFDGQKPLGTGGAIKKSLSKLENNFFVLYGDSFLPINFYDVQDVYIKNNNKALMTIIKNDNQWDKSNVRYESGKLIEYNKKNPKQNMKYVDYGLAVLNKSIFSVFPEIFDLSDLYHDLSLRDDLAGYETNQRFYEIGSMQGLKETENYLKFLKEML